MICSIAYIAFVVVNLLHKKSYILMQKNALACSFKKIFHELKHMKSKKKYRNNK